VLAKSNLGLMCCSDHSLSIQYYEEVVEVQLPKSALLSCDKEEAPVLDHGCSRVRGGGSTSQ
jgi:hypothetical protein